MAYLVSDEVRIWAQAFANCAIEGNRFAIYMTELWDRDKQRFEQELLTWLKGRCQILPSPSASSEGEK